MSKGMLSTDGLELTSVVNTDTSWKVLKGKRSSLRRGRQAVAKFLDRSSAFVCENSRSCNMPISESEKNQVNVLDCNFSDKLEHLPIKKRRFLLRSPSPPPKIPSPVNEENPNFSKSQDVPVQFSVACPVSSKFDLGVMSVDKEDVQGNSPKKVNENLKSIGDFSGISMLAAAAASSSLGREFGYAEDGSRIEEPSVHEAPVEVSTNCEAQSLSKGVVKEECFNTSEIFIGGISSCGTTALAGEFAATSTVDCTSEKVENLEKSIKEPFHEDGTPTVSSDVSSMKDEDVVGSQTLQSRDHRLHWDLNTVMDAWEPPSDHQNAHTSDQIFKGIGNDVRCAVNRSAEDHDLLNGPESSLCDIGKKLLHYEPRNSLDQISEGKTRNQFDDINHKNQSVSECNMYVSSECKNFPSSLGDGNISVQYLNERTTALNPFDIKKHADNQPTGESMNYDVAAPLFTDQRVLSVPPVPDSNCAALTKNTSVSVIDTQVGLSVPPTLDIVNELTLRAQMSDKPFDDRSQSLKNDVNCAKIYPTLQVNYDATPEKVQKENDHPQRSSCLHEFTFKEVQMATAEEKFVSDPCSTHDTETAVKLQVDNDSQYEDGELREPTELILKEYDAANEKTVHIDYRFDNSKIIGTASHHHDSESGDLGQIRRMRHSVGNAEIINSDSGVANELGADSDMSIDDDSDHPKDESSSLLNFVHSGDEKMKGSASTKMLESTEMSLATVVRVRDDCEGKGRIYSLATRSPGSEGTDKNWFKTMRKGIAVTN